MVKHVDFVAPMELICPAQDLRMRRSTAAVRTFVLLDQRPKVPVSNPSWNTRRPDATVAAVGEVMESTFP